MSVVRRAFTALSVALPLLVENGVAAEELSPAAYCRQEAAEYGIQPEQIAEYVEGCVQAMGGSTYLAPDEAGDDGGSVEAQIGSERE